MNAILFDENSELLPVTRQKIVKLRETLKKDKLTRWLWFNSRGVKTTDFYGGTVCQQGGSYGEQQWNVFCNFVKPFLEDAIVKTLDETIKTCRARRLKPEEPYIRETAMLLDGYLIDQIYRYMADIDRRLRGGGYPKSVSRKDVTEEIDKMAKFLDKCKDEMIQGIRAEKSAETSQVGLQQIIEVLKRFYQDDDYTSAISALPPIEETDEIICRSKDKCGAKTTNVIGWLGSAAIDGSGYCPAMLSKLASLEVIADLEKWNEKPVKIKAPSYLRSQSIQELVSQSEGHNLEFKETFQYNIRTKKTDKDLRHDALKTIAGFLNADGGTLLIGISDNGEVKGIEIDKKAMNRANNDKFELDIRNHISGQNSKFNPSAIGCVKFEFEELQDHTICIIDVQPLPKLEILHFEDKVYVRDGNRTLELTGKELSGWTIQRQIDTK